MGRWDELDKRTDLDEYQKKQIKMDDELYLNASRAMTCLMFPSAGKFRESLKDFEEEYPSVVTFLKDKFWDQVVPETTTSNGAILEQMKELANQGFGPGDMGFPELEGETLLEVMLTLIGTFFKDKLMDHYLNYGVNISEEQTDSTKKEIAYKIRRRVNK